MRATLWGFTVHLLLHSSCDSHATGTQRAPSVAADRDGHTDVWGEPFSPSDPEMLHNPEMALFFF